MSATDEDFEQEPELYDCETCAVAEALDGLWPENAEAWELFHKCVTRFTVDTQSVAVAIEAVTAHDDPDDRLDQIARFSMVYDILHPPPKKRR